MTTIRVRTSALIAITALAAVTIASAASATQEAAQAPDATPKDITWGPCPAGSPPGSLPGPWNRPTAPILLLANGQGDPETPYEGARRTERILGNAQLLTLDAWGHGAANRSACVDAALDAYLASGRLPARDTVCAPDHQPFDPR